MTITGTQIMIARGLLGWSRVRLAIESNVGAHVIAGVENATRPFSASAADRLRHVLETAGVAFMIGSKSGVKLKSMAAIVPTANLRVENDGWRVC
jgi:ribosome-binding protein aMBF1 (putative translation factor)